ncbi:MAG: hypothetical protein WCL14_08800 [Bacteroidota bacterium]
MKNHSWALIILLFVTLTLDSCGQAPQKNTVIDCDDALWEHVYHANRLKVIEQCKHVTGVIYKEKREKDGDLHICLKLDAGQENLLNAFNIDKQHGCLVLEPVCVNEVTQKDAIGSCNDYVNRVVIPKVGEHVEVVGSYVEDEQHGWREIHPVTRIKILND